jgi:uncharacterized FAD-dependent dehydrogenase
MLGRMADTFDFVIVGTGPAGLGAAFTLTDSAPGVSLLLIDKSGTTTGGLVNDCKMNFTFPIGFPLEYWSETEAGRLLERVRTHLRPKIMPTRNLSVYARRAEKLGVRLLEVRQAHLGTDVGVKLSRDLVGILRGRGVEISLNETAMEVRERDRILVSDTREIGYRNLLLAPGRKGFAFLQTVMDGLGIPYIDNTVDIGIRIETREHSYPIVRDYYDPKFLFPERVRTFCTNSGRAYVVKEKYQDRAGNDYFSVNGHSFSDKENGNGLVNFALLKTVRFTAPLASGQEFAQMLGRQAMIMGGGQPLMQRVGDFRLGKRSKAEYFTGDLYDFEPTLSTCTPGDISLAIPAKILRAIWKSMKALDTIVPGVLHPSSIMYYPEIKLYGNRPKFMDGSFQAKPGIYLAGDGAGTSRGITAAWASGIRAAEGMLATFRS